MIKPTIVVSLLSAIIILSLAQVATAQRDTLDWSEPERVWGYEDSAEAPFMVADGEGTVHAMNSRESTDGAFGTIDITYRRWNSVQGWTEPIDVILSPKKDIARIRGLAVDDEGYLHMVFYGGDEQDASIYYTVAPAVNAARAPAWSAPTLIGEDAGPINNAAFATDGNDRLFVVYTGHRDGGLGAYSTFSLDSGLTWSEPKLIHVSEEGRAPTRYDVLVDQAGRLHVAWADADLLSGHGQLLYYARLDEHQSTWTQPTVLAEAEAGDQEVDTPAFAEHDGRLILIYHDDFPTTRFMRQSTDGGRTWTQPVQPFQQVGSNGPPSFIHDSAGILHVFFGGRTGNPAIHGMWHSVYTSGDLSKPVAVVSGPQIVDEIGGDGFDPGYPKTALIRGNTVLLVWATDGFAGLNGVYHSYAALDTPEIAFVPLPTLVPRVARADVTGIPTPTLEVSPTPSLDPVPDNIVTANSSPMTPLLVGAASVMAMVSLIFAGKAVRRKG